jgi:RNA polymerase sigma-70 factor (ECF subfamily)
VNSEDLEWATACARGDAGALARFEAEFRPLMMATARRFGSLDFANEVAQAVRERLLVADGERSPRIADYSGQGPLAGYVQAVTVRLSLNRLASESRRPVSGDEVVFDRADGRDDPEVTALKTRYRTEFKQAFASAMEALEPDLRAALRLFYLDGLSLADLGRLLGRLYGWSVPTASRRLAATRETVLHTTRDALSTRLKLTPTELDSVLRLIESRLSVDALKL